MTHRLCTATLFFVGAVGVAGCQKTKAPPPDMPPPAVTVVKPILYPVQSYREYNGYLEAVERVDVRARVKGYLKKEDFREGEEIAAKTLLYVIDPREYEASLARAVADIEKAKADIASAKAQIRLAEADEARQKEAFDKGAAAKTDLDRAVATLAANRAASDSADANLKAAEAARDTAKLQLEYTRIHSPIAGRINRSLVTSGNLVGQNENTLLTTIMSVDPMYVYFDIPERDLIEHKQALATGRPGARPDVNVPVEVGLSSEAGFPHVGRVAFRENRADVGTGTVRIWGLLDNPQIGPSKARLLYPGLFSRVRVPVGDKASHPVIPEDALMTGQEGRYVYVVGANNTVAKRSVVVGTQVYRATAEEEGKPHPWVLVDPTAGGAKPSAVRSLVAVEKGLAPTDVVIVDGLQKARPGAPVKPESRDLTGPPPPK